MSAEVRIISVVGARPQFVKLAPLCRALSRRHHENPERQVTHVIIHTGQHYDFEMAELMFRELGIPAPARNLGVGSGPQGQQIARIIERLDVALAEERPDWVVTYGDTNSTLAAAIVASRRRCRLAHVEAGCRSLNMNMPEEQNRIVTDHLSDLLLVASETAISQLQREGIGGPDDPRQRRVAFVGDLMYDALLANIDTADERAPVLLRKLKLERGAYNLLTLHRAENTENVEAVLALLDALQQAGRPVLFPVHPRTRNLLPDEVQQRYPAVRIVEPLGYLEMLAAERHASTILTDSGGVQKEAFYLNVPCLTLRHETEWPETLHAGANVLVGMDPVRVLTALRAPSPGVDRSNQPFGSGNAAERIVAELLSAVTRAKESKPTAAVA